MPTSRICMEISNGEMCIKTENNRPCTNLEGLVRGEKQASQSNFTQQQHLAYKKLGHKTP